MRKCGIVLIDNKYACIISNNCLSFGSIGLEIENGVHIAQSFDQRLLLMADGGRSACASKPDAARCVQGLTIRFVGEMTV